MNKAEKLAWSLWLIWNESKTAHAPTTTKAGLKIRAELDQGHYQTGPLVSGEQLCANLKRADFHGDWNYSHLPRSK
jgi:hypothetical protein